MSVPTGVNSVLPTSSPISTGTYQPTFPTEALVWQRLDPSGIFSMTPAIGSPSLTPVHPERILKMVAGMKAFESGKQLYEELSELCQATRKKIVFVHDVKAGSFAFIGEKVPGFLCISCPQEEKKEFWFIGLDTQSLFKPLFDGSEIVELDLKSIRLMDEGASIQANPIDLVKPLGGGQTVEGFILGHELSHAGCYLNALKYVKKACENDLLAACNKTPSKDCAPVVQKILHNKLGFQFGIKLLENRIEAIVGECKAKALSPESTARYIADELIKIGTLAAYAEFKQDWSKLGLSAIDLVLCPSLGKIIPNVEEARNMFTGQCPTGERAFLRELSPNWVRLIHTLTPEKAKEEIAVFRFALKTCFDFEKDAKNKPITNLILHGILPAEQSEPDTIGSTEHSSASPSGSFSASIPYPLPSSIPGSLTYQPLYQPPEYTSLPPS